MTTPSALERLADLGRQVGGVLHEVKNQLGIILGNLEVIAREPSLSPQGRVAVQMVESSVRRTDAILRGMLSAPGPSEGSWKSMRLDALIADTLALVATRTASASITVQQRVSNEVLWMAGNPLQMQQALLNLLTNAVEAMPHGGSLVVGASNGQALAVDGLTVSACALEVTDTGEGITPACLARLGEPFFTTKGAAGTGLGLAVSRAIVEHHYGRLRVESQPGRGTTVTVLLPLVARPR